MARGRPKDTEDSEFVDLIGKRNKIALTTGDIADRLGIHRKTALRRLKNLEENGVLEHDVLGKDAIWAWYLRKGDPYIRDGSTGSVSERAVSKLSSVFE